MKAIAFLSWTILLLSSSRLVAADKSPDPELKQVLQAVQPILDKLKPAAKVEYPEGSSSLRISYLPQSFKIHSVAMTGEISAEAHDENGPSFKGFVLEAQLQPKGQINQGATPQTLTRPYWRTDLDVTPLDKSDKQVFWGLSYGGRMDEKILVNIREKLKSLKK